MKFKEYSISKTYEINSVQLFEIVSYFENYSKWNTVIPDAKGKLIVGEELSLMLKFKNQTKLFNPIVVSVDDGNNFLLSKTLISKRIGEITHNFSFTPLSENSTRFTQRWIGKGILMRILWSKIEQGFSNFNIFNDDLESYVKKQNDGPI